MTAARKDDKIEVHKRRKENKKMTQYRIRSSEDGSTVEMLTNKGWIEVVHFVNHNNSNHTYAADRWVAHQMRLDRQDNA